MGWTTFRDANTALDTSLLNLVSTEKLQRSGWLSRLLFALRGLHAVENFASSFDLELLFIEPVYLQVISRLEVLGGGAKGDAMRQIDLVKILINQN